MCVHMCAYHVCMCVLQIVTEKGGGASCCIAYKVAAHQNYYDFFSKHYIFAIDSSLQKTNPSLSSS